MNTTIPSSTEFIKIATKAVQHFGFDPLVSLKKEADQIPDKKKIENAISAADRKTDAMHGILTSGISSYLDNNLHAMNRPVLFSTVHEIPRVGDVAIGLHVIGVEKSIAEVLLIQTTRSLLTELGYGAHTVRINSLGDKESIVRYTRELTNFFKRRMEEMTPTARELMKEHSFQALEHLIEKDHEMSYRSPSPLEYLSDASRKHFREIVEFLDMAHAPYEIDSRLMGHHLCYSDALFSIELKNTDGEPLADAPFTVRGGRYNEFVKRHSKANVAAASAVITLNARKAPARFPRPCVMENPSVFLVQLGFGPKIRSLLLLEDLKHANIASRQSFSSDSLSDQLRQAEKWRVPYALILGQKEFVDDTVIVRDMRSHSQESIPMLHIISHLRRVVRV